MRARYSLMSILVTALLLLGACPGLAQVPDRATPPGAQSGDAPVDTAPVIVDGRRLFSLCGIRSFPASQRVAIVADRIRELARNSKFDPQALQLSQGESETWIGSGNFRVLRIADEDADFEGVDRNLLGVVYVERIRQAIVSYRADRTRAALTSSAWRAGVATVLAVLPFLLLRWLLAAFGRWESRNAERVKSVSIRSFELLGAKRIWVLVHGGLRFAVALLLALVVIVYLQYVLALFPWTRGIGVELRRWLVAPFEFLGRGLLGILPNLIFLAIVVLVVRYVLRLVRVFFQAVARGEVTLKGFYAEWAIPTFNLLQIAVVGLTLVVVYPYIPGSSSDAFKGVSIFAAALFSLGSTSVIANLVAGYTMLYRRAFGEGDVVKIAGILGIVTKTRLQVTHLRTLKNEEVIVPNSTILNSEIMNYCTLARDEGLILHTKVGIGYETPWRQVEAMLLEAADRTPGLLKDPGPFVRQLELGDFAVTYQINAFCREPREMLLRYSDLHANILDIFNEYGVQIMTPAYEGDPAEPKVVPRERWHLPPAGRATGFGGPGEAPRS